MYKSTVYFLSILIVLTLGGSFHSHKNNPYAFVKPDTTESLSGHNCNDNASNPEDAHDYTCLHCLRISTSSTVDCVICFLGGISLVDEIYAEENKHHPEIDFLTKSEPRSPPMFI